VPAVLHEIGDELHLSGFQLSLLTAVPVVCMGLLAPPSQRLAVRFGSERVTTYALALLTGAELLRLGGHSIPVLYLSTLLSGAAMGATSTVMPGLIGHHLIRTPGLGAGVYSMAMAVGSTAAAWLTVSLTMGLGGWNRSLASWAALTAVTTILWALFVPRLTRTHTPESAPDMHRLPWRSRTARLLCGYFAMQTLLGFSGLTWIAPAYRARGWAADDTGLLLSAFFAVQILAMLLLPAITDRTHDRRPLIALSLGATAAGMLVFAAFPAAGYLGAVLYGIGVGGGFSLGLVLLVDVTSSREEAAGLSAMVFLLSYTFAGLGPVLVGVLHDATGGFTIGFLVLFVLGLAQLAIVPALRPGLRLSD
jgi:CP family cyanate transporter-like MFS transporter